MIGPSTYNYRVLAIDPATRGFGFVVMEGPRKLVDWGVKSTKTDREGKSVEKLEELISIYLPTFLIVERVDSTGSRRCRQVALLIKRLVAVAAESGVRVRTISRADVRQEFARCGASTKNQIALQIGRELPELAPKVPPSRKPWMSENYQMPVFDAAALALTFISPRARTIASSRDLSVA